MWRVVIYGYSRYTVMLLFLLEKNLNNQCSLEHTLQLVTVTVWSPEKISLPLLIMYILLSSPLGSLIPFWRFEGIGDSLMRPSWPKLASLARNLVHWSVFSFLVLLLSSK